METENFFVFIVDRLYPGERMTWALFLTMPERNYRLTAEDMYVDFSPNRKIYIEDIGVGVDEVEDLVTGRLLRGVFSTSIMVGYQGDFTPGWYRLSVAPPWLLK